VIDSKWSGDLMSAKFNLSGGEVVVKFESFNDYYMFINEMEKEHSKAIRLGENAMADKLRRLIEEVDDGH